MPDGFTPTYIRWYNDDGSGHPEGKPNKVASADVGPYRSIPFGARKTGEKHAQGKPPHPEHGQWQWGIACSSTSRTLALDIDHPEHWPDSHAADILGEDWASVATSYRVTPEGEIRAHIMIEVPEELLGWWPRQGQTQWGDIKSAGFTYVTGVHASGTEYRETGRPWLTATEELMHALNAEPRKQGTGGGGSGASAGRWADDDYEITGDSQLTADIASMVTAGLSDEQIHDRLDVILKPLTTPWTPHEIEGKIASAHRKSVMWEEETWASEWAVLGGRWESPEVMVQELQRHLMENIELATPAGIQADTTEWIDHHIAQGADFRKWPLADRLNPMRRPIEPAGTSDRSNSTEILETGMQVFRYAADEGCWLQNTGTYWETWGTKSDKQEIGRTIASAFGAYLKTEEILNQEMAAQGTAQSREEIESGDNPRLDRLKTNWKRFTSSAAQGSIATALITEARASSRHSVMVGELDAEPDVLWGGGYPWSLRHEALTLATDVREVNPVHLKTAACAPFPAPCPAFEQVLEAVWPDPEVRAWALREIAGVALWGSTSKSHPVLDGPPGGGKSTFALILVDVLGSYAVQVSPDKILGSDSSSAHEEEVAAMIGARLVWMDEPPPGGKQSISRFNDLASGTGKISAARKYQNRVTAPKLFNFLICQNPRNGLRMDAQGVGERMTFIPCTGAPESTKAAWERWKREGSTEYPAVLAMLIRECALFHSGQRLPVPLGAQFGRAEAQERADEFGSWVLENYDVLSDAIPTTDQRLTNSPTLATLRTRYNETCARPNRQPVVSAPEAADQLRRLGIKVAIAAGERDRRRKNVTYLLAKPTAFSNGY